MKGWKRPLIESSLPGSALALTLVFLPCNRYMQYSNGSGRCSTFPFTARCCFPAVRMSLLTGCITQFFSCSSTWPFSL